MKTLQKNFYWIICTVVLAMIVIYGLTTVTLPQLRFSISSDGEIKEISIYEADDGNCYVFLPSYASMDDVCVVLSTRQQISLGGIQLSNAMTCEGFAPNTAYSLKINGLHKANLIFLQSANVATMYIDTATGSMAHIHQDKNYEEKASLTLYAADGKVDHLSAGNILKGRGNATWSHDKRPYSLRLSSDADLLGMGAATNWVLLANATDETNLNNFLVFDLASRLGVSWAPECRYVDLYLNGEYSGLYLLAEKVEVGSNRLNIDSAKGDFLCKIELDLRWDTLRNPFLTNAGRTVELTYPKSPKQADESRISNQVNQLEQIILSGADLNAEETLDLDSWVFRYLIDEISGNIDSDMASSYFYFSDGVYYAGPLWDYDIAFGNNIRNQEPNSFIAKNANKSKAFTSPYYSALYENESFYNRMVEMYRSAFLPLLQQMVDVGIQELSLHIENAAQMNSVRWRSMYDTLQSEHPKSVCNVSDLITYLDRRIAFLNQAWLENTDFCTVQFEFLHGEPYWNISVPRGNLLETSYVDLNATVWIDASTQEIFDFNQPITEDVTLSLLPADNLGSENTFTTKDYITFASIAIIGITLLYLLFVDFRQRIQERRGASERSKTNKSP